MIFKREGLDDRQRLLSSVAGLQASGNIPGLTVMIDLAISDLADLTAVYEVLLQGYLFCGYPRAIESFFCLDQVLAGKCGIEISRTEPQAEESSEVLMEKGIAAARLVHGDKLERIRNKISALSPDLGYLMMVEGYGRVLSRPELDIRTRELAVVASLTTAGAPRQLGSHIRGCRNVGCGDSEIYESIFTCQLWSPAVRVSGALGIWSEITGGKIRESIGEPIF
jgi:4-carboxymuconolactone decarboxylase